MRTNATGNSGRATDRLETKRGGIRHRHRKMSKGIEMLRLERELALILERWRAAVKANPDAWK